MPDEPLSSPNTGRPPTQADYDLIHAALTETGRGQWFLEEFARRNRNPDTALLLAAIQRLEALVTRHGTASESGRYRSILDALAETAARADFIDGTAVTGGAHAVVSTAAGKIRDLAWQMRGQNYDEALCDALDARLAEITQACAGLDAAAEGLRAALALLGEIGAQVAAFKNPDAAASQPAVPPGLSGKLSAPVERCDPAVIQAIARELNLALAEGEEQPPPAPTRRPAFAHASEIEKIVQEELAKLQPVAKAEPAAPPPPPPAGVVPFRAHLKQVRDPLAPIRAMSEEEKIALFS